jgi:hypothetical protein
VYSTPARIIVALLLLAMSLYCLHTASSVPASAGGVIVKVGVLFGALLLYGAHGLFHRLPSARFAMYGYFGLGLIGAGYLTLAGMFNVMLVTSLAVAAAFMVYVHQYFRRAAAEPAPPRSGLQEVGYAALTIAAVAICLFGLSLTREPQLRTLTTPVSIAPR